MVGPRVYHLKHARSYPAFTAQDPAKVMELANQWLKRHDFHVRVKGKQHSHGKKRGIHVNFVPKYKLYIEQGTNGHYVVRFDYYAKIKLGTAVVVGVVTSGISTVVGVGTLAVTLADADHFVDKFWKHIDSLARGTPVILTVERWASDGKGNFTKQPTPQPPQVVAPHPSHPGQAHFTGPPPPQQAHTTGPMYHGQPVPHIPPNQARVLPAPAPQQGQLPQQGQYGQQGHFAQQGQFPQQGHPQQGHPQQGHVPQQGHMPQHAQLPPPPPPLPQVHLPQYYAPQMPPPVPQQTAAPNVQPGQVYGHNALRSTQSMRPSAPPPTASYPHIESASSAYGSPVHSNYAPSHQSQHSAYPPAQPQQQQNLQSQQPQQPQSYPSPAHNYPPPPPSVQSYGSSAHNYPAAPSHVGYPSPAMHNSSFPPPPTASQQSSYPPAPQFNYPPAPSIAGSQHGHNDAASNASYYDKQAPRGNQMANQGDRQSQYDLQSHHGDVKSNAGGAPNIENNSYYDFNHVDSRSQLKKSNETYNPWESVAIAETRKESGLGNESTTSNLYPPLPPKTRRSTTNTGTPSH